MHTYVNLFSTFALPLGLSAQGDSKAVKAGSVMLLPRSQSEAMHMTGTTRRQKGTKL